MVRSLYSGVSGIQQFQNKLDVIGNNIANSNTVGFKTGRADFEDSFSQSLVAANGPTNVQIGSGVGTSTVKSLFTDGVTASTGLASDLAIQGDGFFVVKDPVSGNTFLSRAGNFSKSETGYLVTTEGYRVQGYSDPALSSLGDIKINDAGKATDETGSFDSFRVEGDGKITVVLDNGHKFTRGQVLLQRVEDPDALIKEGNNLFSGMDVAGALPAPGVAGTNGLGQILGGKLESSNVDLAAEFSSLITTQRGFQASARIITTTDEMLQEVVNLKRS
jgi:flagellar hook protein FlgE